MLACSTHHVYPASISRGLFLLYVDLPPFSGDLLPIPFLLGIWPVFQCPAATKVAIVTLFASETLGTWVCISDGSHASFLGVNLAPVSH